MGTKFDIKKTKQMLKDKIENKIQLWKWKKNINNNQKNMDQIWYKNQIKPNYDGRNWREKNKKRKTTKQIGIKIIRIKLDIKIKLNQMMMDEIEDKKLKEKTTKQIGIKRIRIKLDIKIKLNQMMKDEIKERKTTK